MSRLTATVMTAGLMVALMSAPASSRESSTLTLQAVGCPGCTVNFQSLQAGISRQVTLRGGKAQIRLPVDAGWYGLSVQAKNGMSGGGAATLVVMNYAGYGLGDKVSNRQSRRASFGTSCAYFFQDETVRFIVKRDKLPKRYWDDPDDPTSDGFGRYLRAWASPQEDQTLTEDYRPTNKGQLATQNANCDINP